MGQNVSSVSGRPTVSAAVGLNTEAGYRTYFMGKSSLTTGAEANKNKFKKLGKIIRSVILTPKSQESKDGTTGGKIASGWKAVKLPQLWIGNNTTMSIPSVGAAPSSFSWSSGPQFSTQYLNLLNDRLTGSEKPTRPLFSHYGNGQYMETLHNEYRYMLELHQHRFLNILKAAAPDVHQAFVEWLIIHAGAPVNNGLSEPIVRDLAKTKASVDRASESNQVRLTKGFIGRLKQSHPEQFEFIKKLASVARIDLDLPQDQRRVGDMRKALAPWLGPKMASVLIEDYYQVFDVETLDNEPSSRATPEHGAWSRSGYNSSFGTFSDQAGHSVGGGGRSSTTPMERATDPVRTASQEYRDKGCLSLDTMRKMNPDALGQLIGMEIIPAADHQVFRDLHAAIHATSGFPGWEHVSEDEPTTFAAKTVRQCLFDHVENNLNAGTDVGRDEVSRVLGLVYSSRVKLGNYDCAKVADVLNPRGLIAHVLTINGDLKTAKEQQRRIATDLLLSSISGPENRRLAEDILKVLVRPFIDGHTSFSFQLNPIRRAKQQLLELADDWADSAPVFSEIIRSLVRNPKFATDSILTIKLPAGSVPRNAAASHRLRSAEAASGRVSPDTSNAEVDFDLDHSLLSRNGSVSSEGSDFDPPEKCSLDFVGYSTSVGQIMDSQQFYDGIAELVVAGQTHLLDPISEGPVKKLALILANEDNMFDLLTPFNGDHETATKVLVRAVGLVDGFVASGAVSPPDVLSFLNGYVDGQETTALGVLDRAQEVGKSANRSVPDSPCLDEPNVDSWVSRVFSAPVDMTTIILGDNALTAGMSNSSIPVTESDGGQAGGDSAERERSGSSDSGDSLSGRGTSARLNLQNLVSSSDTVFSPDLNGHGLEFTPSKFFEAPTQSSS